MSDLPLSNGHSAAYVRGLLALMFVRRPGEAHITSVAITFPESDRGR